MTRPPHLRAGLISATLVVLAVAAWLLARPDPDRRRDELRHHQRHQHGAALPQRRPRGVVRPAADYQRRGHRRLPQHDAAHRRPAPHHRRQGRSLRHQGRQQRLRRSRRAPRARTWSASSSLRVAARRARPALAAHAVHGRAALRRHGPLLLLGAKQQRRRRDRRRPQPSAASAARAAAHRRAIATRSSASHEQTVFTASAVAAVAFLASARSRSRARRPSRSADKTPYTEKVSFGYHAKASAGPVYPDGVVSTGDPIFLKLVHRVRVKAHYRLEAKAAAPASAARWRSSCASRARPAGAAPSSSPRPSASPATTPPPT